jgi:hypothetical protein
MDIAGSFIFDNKTRIFYDIFAVTYWAPKREEAKPKRIKVDVGGLPVAAAAR